MFNISTFVKEGLKNTLLFRNNAGMSHNGPWVQVYPNTVLDRFHVGDFSSVEYTIAADYNSELKEILKVLVTATVNTASVVVYARNSTSFELVDIDATVNASYVDVIVNPVNADDSTPYAGVKVIYTAQYFHTQNPPTV
jgi:hypothetical protein